MAAGRQGANQLSRPHSLHWLHVFSRISNGETVLVEKVIGCSESAAPSLVYCSSSSIYILFCLSLSFFTFLSVKPRSYGHFPSPTPSVSPRGIFNKTHLLSSSACQLSIQTARGRPGPGHLALTWKRAFDVCWETPGWRFRADSAESGLCTVLGPGSGERCHAGLRQLGDGDFAASTGHRKVPADLTHSGLSCCL